MPEPEMQNAPYRQPAVGDELVRREHLGHCPDCGAGAIEDGPRGGAAMNRRCRSCGQWWNTLWPQAGETGAGSGLALIQRIGK